MSLKRTALRAAAMTAAITDTIAATGSAALAAPTGPAMSTLPGATVTALHGSALSALPGSPLATPPGPGVAGVIVWQKTIGGTDLILRDITIPPGQATGWHYHQGTLYAQVKQGTLSHFDHTCAADGTYRQGQFLTEPSGDTNVHIGRNLGRTNVVLEVLYVNPAGAPLSNDAPNPGCDFQ